jgi:hypothetical protein
MIHFSALRGRNISFLFDMENAEVASRVNILLGAVHQFCQGYPRNERAEWREQLAAPNLRFMSCVSQLWLRRAKKHFRDASEQGGETRADKHILDWAENGI